MRILLISHHYAPEIGAPQRRWAALVKRWAAAGHELTVLTSIPHYPVPAVTADLRRGVKPFRISRGEFGERVIRMPFWPHDYSVPQKMLDQLVVSLQSSVVGLLQAQGPFDVVITTIPAISSLIPGQLAAALHRIPHIVEMRDAWPDLVTHTPGLEREKNMTALLRQTVHRLVTSSQLHADLIVTTTQEFAEILEGRGVHAVSVIRNGTDLAEVRPLAAPDAAQRELRILYLGTIGRSQGLMNALRAAEKVSKAGMDIRLRFVGEGADKANLLATRDQWSFPVEFHDSVPQDAVQSHYAWADTVIVALNGWGPFEWTVPSKLYEVLAVDRHISGVLAGEAASIVRRADAGFVVCPGDADRLAEEWLALARDRTLLDTGGRGRAWVGANASYDVLSAEYLERIEALVQAHRLQRRQRSFTLAQVLRNLLMLGRLAAEQALEDPAHLAVNVMRRMPPTAARAATRGLALIPAPSSRLLAAYLRGDSSAVGHWAQTAPKTAAELGVGGSSSSSQRTARARGLWREGRLTDAIESLDGATGRSEQRLRFRMISERATMLPDFTLDLPKKPLTGDHPESGSTPRVLQILTNSLPHTQSGYTLRTQRLAEALVRTGIRVDVLTRYGYPAVVGRPIAADVEVCNGVVCHRSQELVMPAGLAARLRRHAERASELAGRLSPTVIHATTNYVNGLVAQSLALAHQRPWIYEVRGFLEQTWASSKPTEEERAAAAASEKFALLRAQETRLMLAADCVLTLSEEMRQEILGRGVAPEKVRVLPNAVPARLVAMGGRPRDPQRLRSSLGLPSGGQWVGAVSSLVDYEGFHTLLRAAAHLRSQGRDIRVLLAGSGSARSRLEHLASELGLGSAVVFPGRIAPARSSEYLRALDAVCLPRVDSSVTRAVTPLKPIEAMALSVPLIMSDLPPLRGLAAHGSHALLVAPDDPEAWAEAIAAVLDHPEAAAARAAAGRRFASSRTWEANAASYRALIDEITAGAGA